MPEILDIGCGSFKYPGAIGIDYNPSSQADVIHDLNVVPYPFPDNKFDFIHTSHCLEHLDNVISVINEMWRIAKPGATILIKVPHFSGRVAWSDIEHKRAFSSDCFKKVDKFVVEKVRLSWHGRLDKHFLQSEKYPQWVLLVAPIVKAVDFIITSLANINVLFCETIWCYYVGGFGEVQYTLRVVKT